ncbi:MAG: hypothetical protein GC159_08150 [Phycisphaera sp.]|nr:hypothetical protein [Phycisphaera sp.]
MISRIKQWLGLGSKPEEFDEAAAEAWYEHKSRLLEDSLGAEHDIVMHAIIPYSVGGGLDLYYYPNGVSGTAIATKELSVVPGQGSANRVYRNYELVMFTPHALDLDNAGDDDTPFGKSHATINRVLNAIARYSEIASLNPHETSEFPDGFGDLSGKCFIFDGYALHDDEQTDRFGLLLIMEVFRSEMQYAMDNGGAKLIKLLRDAGHYPYSDLDRAPVV